MQVVHADIPAAEEGRFAKPAFADHRSGEINFQRLIQGEEKTPQNFEWSLVRFGPDYTTPRHHHNFDQLHLVLKGRHQWANDEYIPEGWLGYFPEGAFYGPQQGEKAVVLGLQLGGAGGEGFMSYDQLSEGNKRLHPKGTFEDGVFHYVDADGKRRNKDGYEAIWEEVHGRPVVYPAPRYQRPVIINPDAFSWIPVDGEEGVERKLLGVFTEREIRAEFTRYEASARHRIEKLRAPLLHFVRRGCIRAGDGTHGAGTAMMFETGEGPVTIEATEPTETYSISLPVF